MASGDRPDTSRDPTGSSASPPSRKKKDGKRSSRPSSEKAKKMTDEEQREAFIRTAREVEVDETGDVFEVAVSRVLGEG